MAIPKEIRDLRLSGQLPTGNIAYLDTKEPDTLRLLDQTTWKPVKKMGVEIRLDPNRIARRFPAVIVHVPSRSPDNSFDEIISRLSKFLKRTSQREDRIVTLQNLGALFVVEDKGQDLKIGWRQTQLTRAGLVVDRTQGGSVVVNGDYIISFARRPKQRSPIDLTKGERSQYMVEPFIQEIEAAAERQGFTANTSRLRQAAKATRNPRQTIGDLRYGMDVDYETANNDGKRILVHRSESTETVTPNREALQELTRRQVQEKKSSKPQLQHKAGDIVRLESRCGDCGGEFQKEYYEKPGKVRTLLFSRIICPNHPGGPATIESNIYEGYLGFLPKGKRELKLSS